MNIGYDLDGVVIKFGAAVNKYLLERYTHEIDITKIAEYSDLAKVLEDYKEDVMSEFTNGDEGHLLKAEPYEDAVELINKRYNEGHNVYFITARLNKEVALKSLERCGFLYTDAYFANADDKYTIIKNLDLDFYIDDRLETLISIYENGIHLIPVIRDQPWNRNKPYPLHFIRVFSLTEFDFLVERVLEIRRTID